MKKIFMEMKEQGVIVEDTHEDDINHHLFLHNKLDNMALEEEFDGLDVGESMLIGYTHNEMGELVGEYVTKQQCDTGVAYNNTINNGTVNGIVRKNKKACNRLIMFYL